MISTKRTVAKAEAEAWREYLDETKRLPPNRYEMVEAWAWLRLRKRLAERALRGGMSR